MLHLCQRHRSLLRRCGCQRNAGTVKVVKEIDDAGEGLGIKKVGLISGPVTGDEAGEQLTLISQVAEGIPERRADIGAKALVVGDRKIEV